MKDFNMLTLGQLLYDLNDSYTHFDVYEQEDTENVEDVLPSKKKILSDATTLSALRKGVYVVNGRKVIVQ